MPIFDTLPNARFGGIDFPVSQVEVHGGLDHHIHKYPHAPGAAFEALGRKLYEITMHATFSDTFRKYPNLWPGAITSLRALFDDGAPQILVIPTLGDINAFAVEWPTTVSYKFRSGETAVFKFVEDISQYQQLIGLVVIGKDNLASEFTSYQIEHDEFALREQGKPEPFTGSAFGNKPSDLFSAIQNAANAILSIGDTVDLFGRVLTGKIDALTAILEETDRQVASLREAKNWKLADALHRMGDAARAIGETDKRVLKLTIYIVPHKMSVSDVSRAVYGDASHAIEILQLNDIADAFAIPAGTKLRVVATNKAFAA